MADVFDALLNDRCYKKAWPLEQVLELFRKERGKQFDPDLVDLMFNMLDELEQIRTTYTDEFKH